MTFIFSARLLFDFLDIYPAIPPAAPSAALTWEFLMLILVKLLLPLRVFTSIPTSADSTPSTFESSMFIFITFRFRAVSPKSPAFSSRPFSVWPLPSNVLLAGR